MGCLGEHGPRQADRSGREHDQSGNGHQTGKWCLSLENVNTIKTGLLPVMINDRGDGGSGRRSSAVGWLENDYDEGKKPMGMTTSPTVIADMTKVLGCLKISPSKRGSHLGGRPRRRVLTGSQKMAQTVSVTERNDEVSRYHDGGGPMARDSPTTVQTGGGARDRKLRKWGRKILENRGIR